MAARLLCVNSGSLYFVEADETNLYYTAPAVFAPPRSATGLFGTSSVSVPISRSRGSRPPVQRLHLPPRCTCPQRRNSHCLPPANRSGARSVSSATSGFRHASAINVRKRSLILRRQQAGRNLYPRNRSPVEARIHAAIVPHTSSRSVSIVRPQVTGTVTSRTYHFDNRFLASALPHHSLHLEDLRQPHQFSIFFSTRKRPSLPRNSAAATRSSLRNQTSSFPALRAIRLGPPDEYYLENYFHAQPRPRPF